MANMLFANNCNTTLNGGITAVATSMVVTSATGFPSPTGSQYFYCTLADAATQTTIEIVKVTSVSGTTFTIVRGQDGTTGTIFASGAVVSLRLVAASLNDFPKLDEVNTFSQAQTFSTPIAVGSGGTGLNTLTAGYVPYGNGTSALNTSANLYFSGTQLGVGTSTTFATISAELTGGNAINARYNSGNSRAGIYVGGSSGNPFFGYNLNYSSGNVFNYDKTGMAWFMGDAAGTGYFSIAVATGTSGTSASTDTAANYRLNIFTSGGVSIGNTTDPGATNLSVTGAITSASIKTTGSSVSAPTATPTTLFTMSGANRGSYIVTAFIANSGGPTQYIATATASWDGNGAKIVANNGANLTLTLSGGSVQVTQTAGSTQTVYFSYLYIGL